MAAAAAASNVKTLSPHSRVSSEPREIPGRHVIVVCTGESCAGAGSRDLLSELKHQCRRVSGDLRVGESRCMGHCQLAPAVMEDGRMLGWVSPRRLRSELERLGIR
jgi:NADH:ubiquinone oxidoreductase subunit E